MLDGTLERSGQRMGVEISQSVRQLCLVSFSTDRDQAWRPVSAHSARLLSDSGEEHPRSLARALSIRLRSNSSGVRWFWRAMSADNIELNDQAEDRTLCAGAAVTTGPAASLQNETPRVLTRSRPGNDRHIATNYELLLRRS
jgi:hypothetical protein